MSYIYEIRNLKNNKVYVGATTRTPNERFEEHCKDAKRFPHRPLYIALNKYGYENFSVNVLEICADKDLELKERYWIEKLRSFKYGYNATIGGKGKPYADYDLIISLWNEGKNIKEIHDLTSYDNDTIRNVLNDIGLSTKNRLDRGHIPISKCVHMIDISNKTIIKTFSSIREAYRFFQKISNGHIEQVCKGKRKTAYGYIWKYA